MQLSNYQADPAIVGAIVDVLNRSDVTTLTTTDGFIFRKTDTGEWTDGDITATLKWVVAHTLWGDIICDDCGGDLVRIP